jgi:hypothetical protein
LDYMRSIYYYLLGTLAICCLIFTTPLSAQRNCDTMEHLEMELQNDSKRAQKMQKIEQQTQKFIDNPTNRVNGVITIPVVVHVVYNNSTENISDAQIQSQMDVLNDDFRRLNSDADNTWNQAADIEIEFCMATVDPNGNPTNGITRTATSVSSFSTNDNMKFNSSGGKDAWPADEYLNMWVCDISGGILGYAQFPGGSPSTDGVVMDYQYFGTIGTATAPFDLGRTTTHEVGHWLNLRHIWGDGGCSVDDFVSDTPTSDAANYGCSLGHVSCGSTDMVQNYMDYSDDACMNLFTFGQRTRMRALFDNGGFREGLLTSGGCGSAPTPTCSDGIQNGQETGVDCGGPDCPACPPCTDVTVTINLDNYPEETSWTITDANGAVVASGGTYGSQPDGSTVTITNCLADGCYDFNIADSYGDGICCSYGNGSYTLTDANGNTLASGGSFGSSETTNFCIGGGPVPTCNDGIQNGDETGVDCGGSDCPACPTCNDGIQNGDETGIDCGGSDCPACPTCNDGIQNGDETGVDCGGSDCPACPTCNDGIQNGDETGVDCGGSDCPACPTCNDGIQNGDETGVDCGGSDCPACPTCNDGIQNGDETGVDCGGPDCAPCNTGGCTDVTVTISLDNYPEETSWTITDANGAVVASGGTYGSQPDGSTVTITNCLDDGCYDFTINDSYGDGICCSYGNGSYSVTDANGNLLASGGDFNSTETTNFCLGGTPPPSYCGSQGNNTNYEWIQRFQFAGINNTSGNNNGYADYTSQSATLTAGGTASVTMVPGFASSSYSEFWRIWIDYNQDGDFEDAGELVAESNGNGTLSGTVNLSSGALSGATRLRVSMKYNSAATSCETFTYGEVEDYTVVFSGSARAGGMTEAEISQVDNPAAYRSALELFPNPAQELLNLNYNARSNETASIELINMMGQRVKVQVQEVVEGKNTFRISLDQLPEGAYLVRLKSGNEQFTEKLTIAR